VNTDEPNRMTVKELSVLYVSLIFEMLIPYLHLVYIKFLAVYSEFDVCF